MAERRRVHCDSNVFLDYVNGVPEKLLVLDAVLDRTGANGDIEKVTSPRSIQDDEKRCDGSGRRLPDNFRGPYGTLG